MMLRMLYDLKVFNVSCSPRVTLLLGISTLLCPEGLKASTEKAIAPEDISSN